MNRPRWVSGRAIARVSAPDDPSAPCSSPPGGGPRQYTATFLRTARLGLREDFAIEEALLVPMVAFLVQAALFSRPLLLAGLLAGGTIGFSAVGTLFAAMLVRARSRDVLLPILLYPITIPVIIAGVRGTAALLAEIPDEATATMWIGILAAFDTVFVTLALWTFEPLMTE